MQPDASSTTDRRAHCAEADFQSLAETLSSLIALIRGDKIVYVNPATCELLGRPREWFRDRDFWDVVHPDDRQAAMARGRARAAGVPQQKRLLERLQHADGHAIWMDYSVDVLLFEGLPTTLVTGHDVSERRHLDEQYRRSEARLAEAQRIGNIGSWEWDVPGNRITWSEEMCRIFGVEPSDFGGAVDGYFELLHPDDREMAREVVAQALARGGPFAFEHRVIGRDGVQRTIFGRGEVFRDASGAPVRVAGTGQDISERRRMERELQQSEERFRLAFAHAGTGKAIVGPDRRILQINAAACRILGYEQHELIGLHTDAITHPDDRNSTETFVQALLDGRQVSSTIEQRLLHKDGRTVLGHLTATVVRDAAGRPLDFFVDFEDVTERWRAEQALRDSEQRFRNLCKQAPVMLMSVSPDVRIRDISDFWLQTMGYDREHVIGQDAWKFVTTESRRRLEQAIEEGRRNGEVVIKNFPLQAVRGDGGIVDLLSTSVAEMGDDGESKGAICVSINLTDLRRAEVALRESADRYRALVEHAAEAIMVLDADTDRFVDANAHAEKLFGYSRERLLQMGPLDFCPEHQADRRKSCEVVEDQHNKVLAGGTATFEFTHVDAQGRQLACQTLLSRLPAAGRNLIRARITDITELKELQEKVKHAEKLAAVGVLAAGVAHEIGNPLMALSMAAQSLERRTGDDYTQNKLRLIREHIDRIARIVRQMSDLARPPGARRGPCDLNQTVRRAVEMVRHDQRARHATIDYRLAEHLPPVRASEDELIQVCINLALNAFDAMADNPPDRPRLLTIRTGTDDRGVRATFHDTGHGVPAEVRDKLFQPFFTTKQVGQGSGLGLSVSYRILQEHQGALWLDDSVGEGAAFALVLPVGAGR
ncbi:MAG TPA: PAS domain S-box protein [Planctomycetota bacterium]|nr:PAS domain S-box protein [Planctomycetota bacterium]